MPSNDALTQAIANLESIVADLRASTGAYKPALHSYADRVLAEVSALKADALRPAGTVNGDLYCYGGCGRRYEDFGLDTILPTPLWNQIAVGPPFREPHPSDEREGRGGVLCAACIVQRLADIPGTTVARLTVDLLPRTAKAFLNVLAIVDGGRS